MKVRQFISEGITNFVATQLPEKSETELEHIKYGIEASLVNLLKLPIIFVMALFLGIFKYVIISMCAFGAIRTFGAGYHAKTSLSCLLMSISIFFLIVYASLYINLTLPIKVLLFVVSLTLVALYAPADTEERPFVEEQFRKRLRILSITATVIMFILSLVISDLIISNIFFYSIIVESILVSPLLYKIMKRGYRNYEKVQFN